MDAEHFTFWSNLIKKIEPMMCIGQSLLEEIVSLVEKYHIDLNSEIEWEELPIDFKSSLQTSISTKLNAIPCELILDEYMRAGNIFLVVVDMLETQHAKVKKINTTARSFLQNLIYEVMNVSITSKAMNLEDWRESIRSKKEAYQVDDVIEYAYKKLSDQFKQQVEISIYDFFYNKTSPEDIDKLLSQARDSILLAFTQRGLTGKRGHGMSRFIIDYIHRWQDDGLMKPLKSIFPFCQCLQLHWDNNINLGTRQGLEVMYKQRL